MLVVGATYPDELRAVRKIVKDMILLIPGIGAQGGDLKKTIYSGLNSKKKGMIISSSRSIIFASKNKDFAEKARLETKKLAEAINALI
jgi:orotidine-5'-phosphate decarboxylase